MKKSDILAIALASLASSSIAVASERQEPSGLEAQSAVAAGEICGCKKQPPPPQTGDSTTPQESSMLAKRLELIK